MTFFSLISFSIVFSLSRLILHIAVVFVCRFPVVIGSLEFAFSHSFPSDKVLFLYTVVTSFLSSVSSV